MLRIGGVLGYHLLRKIAPNGQGSTLMDGSAYNGVSKLAVLLGADVVQELRGKTVLDFGCGHGNECIELARSGAAKVIGLDIQEEYLRKARSAAAVAGVSDRCTFATSFDGHVQAIVSLDSFEHFDDPASILQMMYSMLEKNGRVFVSFGPTWYHPLGGHLFSVFPWSHLIFSEMALIRWRADFKQDGATRFREVAGGLNQMTIGRFERIVSDSPFRLARLRAVPIRRLARLHNRLTREITTAIVQATLVKD
jgi:SAM-dependent methyltransferase